MKKLVLSLAIVAGSAAALVGLCSFTSASAKEAPTVIEVHTHNHVASQGTHCNGTVGCSCSGFAPITNGEEWQKAYCKHCGHKKSCHK